MISRNSKRDIGINISAGAICNIISRVGSRLTKPTKQILASLIMAKILHIDETSYSVNGKLYWVWIILNPDTREVYFDIRNSRGADILKELLPGWNGTIVCDGWRPYGMFEKMQRCWAHIIREARHISERNPDNADARQVHKLLQRVFHDAKRKRQARDSQKDHLLFTLRIKRMLSKYGDNPILESFMTKLQNALPNLFTFVLDPRIPPTNNAAERGLRDYSAQKDAGGMKSTNTPNIMSNIFTCFATWKTKRINHRAEMVKYLQAELRELIHKI